jgi:hypothetical protein
MLLFIDYVPLLLEELPFHNLMRVSTESGERSNYDKQIQFFNATNRGGGRKYKSPLRQLMELKVLLLLNN